jgi:hypothetical protein
MAKTGLLWGEFYLEFASLKRKNVIGITVSLRKNLFTRRKLRCLP